MGAFVSVSSYVRLTDKLGIVTVPSVPTVTVPVFPVTVSFHWNSAPVKRFLLSLSCLTILMEPFCATLSTVTVTTLLACAVVRVTLCTVLSST